MNLSHRIYYFRVLLTRHFSHTTFRLSKKQNFLILELVGMKRNAIENVVVLRYFYLFDRQSHRLVTLASLRTNQDKQFFINLRIHVRVSTTVLRLRSECSSLWINILFYFILLCFISLQVVFIFLFLGLCQFFFFDNTGNCCISL